MLTQIRSMTREDKPSVMKILRATPEFKPAELRVAEELIDSYLRDPSGSGYNIFAAEADLVITGYICYGPTPLTEGTWDIYWVVVASQRQNRGIGSALVAWAESKIKEAQGRLVLIETSAKSEYEKAQRFYYEQGYEVICRIPDFYAVGDDKLILQKRLR